MNTSRLVTLNDPRLACMGRVALDEKGVARMGFPGIRLRFVYSGPAPTLLFRASSDSCFFSISCHGWEPVTIKLEEGDNELPLPSGRAPSEGWLVEVQRRTEAWQGVVTFMGLRLPEGSMLLPPPEWPARKLLCIGDSITGGECIEMFPPKAERHARHANAARSYGALLARRLGAQVHLVSYGGRGVLRDWQGRSDLPNAPQFFHRTLPDEAEPRWDHHSYEPDVVSVCLGTNDLNPGLPPIEEYLAAYAGFVAEIRRVHPGAGILLVESPIFGCEPGSEGNRKRLYLRDCLERVVQVRESLGDLRVRIGPVGHYPGTALDAHPVAFQHEQMAEELLAPLRLLAGW